MLNMLFWLLKFLPAILVHAFMGISLLVFLLSFIPIVPYRIFLKWGGILLVVAGIFLEGCLLTQQAWEAQVAKLEEQVKLSEEKAKQINTEIVEKVVTEQKIVKEKGDQIIKYIDREVTKIDNTCTIPEVVIKAHNAAALNQPIEEEEKPLTPSTVVDTSAHNAAAVPK
jgi:flagellar biosynthesis component FlhA